MTNALIVINVLVDMLCIKDVIFTLLTSGGRGKSCRGRVCVWLKVSWCKLKGDYI